MYIVKPGNEALYLPEIPAPVAVITCFIVRVHQWSQKSEEKERGYVSFPRSFLSYPIDSSVRMYGTIEPGEGIVPLSWYLILIVPHHTLIVTGCKKRLYHLVKDLVFYHLGRGNKTEASKAAPLGHFEFQTQLSSLLKFSS